MERKHRRPAMLDEQTAERMVGDVDPALRSQAAHTTADVLVRRGRAGAEDPELLARLVSLVDGEGVETIAKLWAQSPPGTLPGALLWLCLVREWVRTDLHPVAARSRLGRQRTAVTRSITG